MFYVRILSGLLFLSIFIVTCTKKNIDVSIDENEHLSGGDATTFILSRDAFGQPIPGLTNEEERHFFVGNSLFNQNWVSAPASTTARDGLGPTFNSRSCSGCHFKDGRGKPPLFTGDLNNGLLFRLHMEGKGVNNKPIGDPVYGNQLQDQANLGIGVEGQMQISYTDVHGKFEDGTPYTLRKPTYNISNMLYGALSAYISPRIAQQLCGVGLLEAIPASTIIEFADPNDLDRDGISGKANLVWDDEKNIISLGRFGWKAGKPSLHIQNADAFINDLGITSHIFSKENCPDKQINCKNAPNGGEPEIIDDRLDDVTTYTSALSVSVRRNYKDPKVLLGKKLFMRIGCNLCHKPYVQTGVSNLSALSNQKIFPYTDLLLHDMGEGLADGVTEFDATGREWRTPPLWGVGLIKKVNQHTFLLHDGRARNIMEAILWHSGEAEQSKQHVLKMNKEEREQLLEFLNSL